jgi:hypothetical protein
MTIEDLTIYTIASIRKYVSAAPIGVPVIWHQQAFEKDELRQDEVQILTSLTFPDRGSKTEIYGIVNLQALIKTKVVPTDVYYHTRLKARLLDVLYKVMPLYKVGGTEPKYDKSQWGILRKIPSESITVTPTSIDVPDASVVEVFYEIQPC